MWIPFFKNDKTGAHADDLMDIHHEVTQKIHAKPRVKEISNGYMSCVQCGESLLLDEYNPLSIERCQYCDTPNFFPLKIKNFWLYEPLGGGGMGSVYHAFVEEDPELELAVKVLPRTKKRDEFLVKTLLREAEIGHSFGEHQHLVRIYDYGFADDEYFSAAEYVDGVRLDQVIDSPLQRPLKQILLWALQILAAEQHMFDCGYLFRDLKPQNIIINNEGNIKLIDYGLALSVEDALKEQSDSLEGSPNYLPPERIVGAGEAQCSEIYSLGMVIFHAVARQPYYTSEEVMTLVTKHVTSLRISNVSRKLPYGTDPELIRILTKMIMRTPKERYQTYKEVAAELFKAYKKCA